MSCIYNIIEKKKKKIPPALIQPTNHSWKISVHKISTILQGKTYILLMLPTMKTNLKEWTDNKTFQFRNDLLWTGLQGNYLLWTKKVLGK